MTCCPFAPIVDAAERHLVVNDATHDAPPCGICKRPMPRCKGCGVAWCRTHAPSRNPHSCPACKLHEEDSPCKPSSSSPSS